MRVHEVCYTVFGEGVHVGVPVVLVRLQGCSLGCVYCDTRYALKLEGGEEMSIAQVRTRMSNFSETDWVLLTGGEPLEQDCIELVSAFKHARKLIEIETNGSISPPVWFSHIDSWNVDVKCPSSGPAYGSFKPVWLRKLRMRDQLKFVVCTEGDLNFVRGFLKGTRIRATVLISPVASAGRWKQEWLWRCTDFCKEQHVRLSLQVQKVVYGDRRGV